MQSAAFTDLLKPTLLGALAARHPLTCLDVGSRGGFEADLLPIAFAVDAVGFEPDPVAFAALGADQGPWRSLRHLPVALAGSEGERPLFIPRDPISASLLEHDESIGRRFGKAQFFERDRTATVTTRRLDDASEGLRPVYLKLDVEGAELEILQAAPRTLAGLLALKVEVSFLPFRKGQPLACDIDSFLRGHGFELMELVQPAHWRMHGYVAHPQAGGGVIPYSRGQLAQGDYLYFRHPDGVDGPESAIQAAVLAAAHGYFDHAEILLARAGVDAIPAIAEASRRFGRAVWRHEVIRHLRLLVTYARSFKTLFG
jgi:FkbM family methyltransferase